MTTPRHLSLFITLGLFWGISPSLYRHWGMLGVPVSHIIVLTGIGVAAALAARLQPQALDYCVFCHRSAEQAHRALLEALGVAPLLDLGLRLGEGSGGALGLPLVRGALALFSEMATFDSAGVSGQVKA